jgi:hypothetical protein
MNKYAQSRDAERWRLNFPWSSTYSRCVCHIATTALKLLLQFLICYPSGCHEHCIRVMSGDWLDKFSLNLIWTFCHWRLL